MRSAHRRKNQDATGLIKTYSVRHRFSDLCRGLLIHMYLMCLLIFETPVTKTLHVVDDIFCLVGSRLLERGVPSSSPWEEGMRELNLEEKVVKLL